MARIWSSGFESNSKTGGVEFDNFSATPTSIVTSPVHGGTYAARVNPSATTAQIRKDLYTADQSIVGYSRVYLYITSLPSVDTEIIRWINSAGSGMARLRLTTAGTLTLISAGSSVIGNTSRTLNLNTWYRVEMKNDASTNPGTLEARVDGTQIASGLNSVQGSWMRVDIGAAISTTCDIYFDDLAVNDSSGSYQNSWPGSGKIIHIHPDSAGDINTFSVQSGGTAGAANNYTRTSEITPDDSATYNASVTLDQEDLFNCGASGIDPTDTINVVSVGARFINGTAADPVTALTFEIEKTAAGTKTTSSAIIPNNNTNWRTNATSVPYLYPITAYLDPDGSSWTQATIDSMQIGYKLTAAGTTQARVSTIWALVEHTPTSATANNGAFFSIFE